MMRSKLILSILGLLLIGAAIFWRIQASQNQKASPALTQENQTKAADPQTQEWRQTFRSQEPLRRVEQLYEKESQRIGAIDSDPAATQKRLEVFAGELNAPEMDWLKRQTLNTAAEGDARFFAAYLLALHPASTSFLHDIAASKIPKTKNQGLVELERQIRAQALEGICRKCGERVAEDAILDVMDKQEDDFLRDRGHRCLYAWRTCKPIEDQDKEALTKLQYGR